MAKKPPTTDRANLLRLLVDASSVVRQGINTTLSDTQLNEPMITMLWVLRPSSPMSMRELATKLGYDPSNISVLGDRLEALGLVRRNPHPNDRRRRVLTLTPAGEDLYQRTLTRLYEESPIFSLTQHEQAQLAELLTKIERAGAQSSR